jgi:LysM repeat protein
LFILVGLAACTRSLSGPAPSVTPYDSATSVAAAATQTPTAGQTVIAVETTTTTPIPSMTPTTEVGTTPTATTEPTATATTTAPEPTATPSASEFTYVVRTGDTLWGLAIRFGTTVEAIKARNSLTSDMIYKGDELTIPGTDPGTGQTVTHTVQPGENLFRIALKYQTTVEAISAANSIVNPSLIYAGQKLTIPSGGGTPTTARYHKVQPGETLWSIALKYSTTPWTIAATNGISNINYIYAGQTLRIP